MITLVGTGHIFNLDSSLKTLFNNIKPDLICVELDKDRYNTLRIRYKDSKKYLKKRKNLPILYALFLRYQEKGAKKYGVNPGDEMLTAVYYAQKMHLSFELIDDDFQHLYKKIIESLTTVEKLKLTFIGVFLTFFGWYFTSRKKVKKDLERLDKNFDKNMQKMEISYPVIKKLVLDDRNEYMAQKIMHLMKNYRNIVACVGDGHVVGISRILKSNNVKFDTIRLRSLITN